MSAEGFRERIPGLSEVFIIYSKATRLPFVICHEETFDDEVHLYLKETEAEAALLPDREKEAKQIRKIEGKNLLKVLSALSPRGINAFRFFQDGNSYLYQFQELITLPDSSKLPKKQQPFENPAFSLTMIYFKQALPSYAEGKPDGRIRALEEEMLVNMIRSRVLMPYTETEEGGKKQIRLPFIKMADDRQMIALFTDFVEFSSFTAEKDLRLRGMDFKGLKNFAFPESCAGFLLNPATVAIPFTKKWIQSVQVRDPQGEAKNKSQVEE